jgi:hypothetical protein
VVGKKKGKEKRKKIKIKRGVRGWWGKKEKKRKNNNVIIKVKSKNQNDVPNAIFFFLNCDFSCETKIMYQTEFFLQS